MKKKSNIILSVIIISFIVSVCSIGIVQDNPSIQIENQDDDIITEISAPKTSGYTVTEKWQYSYPWGAPTPDVKHVEISLDGNYIVAIWENNPNATLFHKNSNETVWVYENLANIGDVAISGDGNYIVVCNGSHVICLDNSPEFPKKELWVFDADNTVNYVDISIFGDYIICANHSLMGGNSDVVLLDKNGQVEWVYHSMVAFYDVAISGDGGHVIACDDNADIHMFNTTDYKDKPMWTYRLSDLGDEVAISDNGDYAVASDMSNNVYFFNTTDYDQGVPMWEWSSGNTIRDLAISSFGKYVVVSDTDELFYFNNSFYSGQKLPIWSYDPTDDYVHADINADGKYVIAGTPAGPSAYLFNNSVTNPKDHEWSSTKSIKDVAISGWGDYFVLALDNQMAPQGANIMLFHHERPIPPSLKYGYDVTQRWNDTSRYTITAVAVSADGQYMAVGTTSGIGEAYILFYNTSDHDGRPMWNYTAPGPILGGLAISDDGQYIVAGCPTAGLPQAVLLNWSVPDPGKDKQIIWRATGNQEATVDISADGTRIVIGAWDGSSSTGYIFTYDNLYPAGGGDNKGGDQLWSHSRFGEHVHSVAISDDGRYVAVGLRKDVPNEILFFNLTDYTKGGTQEPMWGFNTSTDVDDLAISYDGYYFAAAGQDTCYLLNRTYPDAGSDKSAMWNVSFAPADLIVTSIDISRDGKHIVVGIDASLEDPIEGLVMVYNNSASTSKKLEYRWRYQTNGNVNSVAITALGEYIVVGTDYNPKMGNLNENTVFLFNNTDYSLGATHNPNWFFNTFDDVYSVSISAWGNYIGIGGESTSGETFLFYHARPVPGVFRPYIAGGDDDDDDDDALAIPFGDYYLVFALIAIVALIIIYKRKTIFSRK